MAKRDWKVYNEHLVREVFLIFDLNSVNKEPERTKKVGRPPEYSKELMTQFAIIRHYMKLPYRQMEGFLRVMQEPFGLERIPDHSTLHEREQGMDLDNLLTKVKVNENYNPDKPTTIAVDSTGIKVTNDGEWIKKKWKVKRKGFLKIHIAVDIETNEIVAIEITNDKCHDNVVFDKLIDDSKENRNVKKALGDGAYDSKDNFNKLRKLKIEPGIKVRKNSSKKAGGSLTRKKVVIEQLGDYDKWKERVGYGMRWVAESMFSCYKRRFGEFVRAIKFENMIREILLNCLVQNLIMRARL